MDTKQLLSKDFQLWEFTTSQTAERFGIDNTPSPEVVSRLKRLCTKILQPARDKLGPLRISSGYRSPRLNQQVKGSESSGHKLGYCADVLPINCSKMAFARYVARNCDFDQVILEFGSSSEPAWIHVSADPRSRRQVLRILPGTDYIAVNL